MYVPPLTGDLVLRVGRLKLQPNYGSDIIICDEINQTLSGSRHY